MNLEAINIFFPVLFLQNAILNKENSSPLTLILAALNTGIKHVNNHQNNAVFDKDDMNTHIKLFVMWCMGVHQATVPKTCFSVDPNDRELVAFGLRLHTKYINPPTTTAPTGLPSSISNVFRSLAAGITRTHEEAEHQNRLHRKQLDFIKDKEEKKRTSTRDGTRLVVALFSTPHPMTLTNQPNSSHHPEDPQFPGGRQTALKLPLALANTTKSSTRVNLLS